jgi:thymidylate synthase ThyX
MKLYFVIKLSQELKLGEIHMTKNNCPVIQKFDELVKKSNELKKELDVTPFEDKQKFMSLLKKLMTVHKNLDQLTLYDQTKY